MTVQLTKKSVVEPTGPIEVGAEWNHSCTPQCPVPCKVSRTAQPRPVSGPTLDSFRRKGRR